MNGPLKEDPPRLPGETRQLYRARLRKGEKPNLPVIRTPLGPLLEEKGAEEKRLKKPA